MDAKEDLFGWFDVKSYDDSSDLNASLNIAAVSGKDISGTLKVAIYHTKTYLNGSITINISSDSVTRERKKLKKLKNKMLEGMITIKEIEGSYISWRGFAKQFDSYDTIQRMNQLFEELFGYIPVDKKTRKKKKKRKIERRINELYKMAEQTPSQYEDESQRWEWLGVKV
jgi:hypothetical protein